MSNNNTTQPSLDRLIEQLRDDMKDKMITMDLAKLTALYLQAAYELGLREGTFKGDVYH